MVRKSNLEKKSKDEYVTIKVKRSTYESLIQTKAYHEIVERRRISMDELINMMIESLPKVDVKGELKLLEEK